MRRIVWAVPVMLMLMPARAAAPTGWVHAQFNAFKVAGITMLIQYFEYNSGDPEDPSSPTTHMYSALINSAVVGGGHYVDPQDGIFNPDDPRGDRVFCEGEPVRIMLHGGVDGVQNGETLSHADAKEIFEHQWVNEYVVDGEVVPLEASPVQRIRFDPREGLEACYPDEETGEEICFTNWGWGKTFGSEILYPEPGKYEVRWTQNIFHCAWLWRTKACGECTARPDRPFTCTVTTPFEVLEAEACSP
jgi:hypothetical protein